MAVCGVYYDESLKVEMSKSCLVAKLLCECRKACTVQRHGVEESKCRKVGKKFGRVKMV